MSESVSNKVITGAVWYVAMRWSMRALGLVSIAILARLLTPSDFGVVALATAATGLMEAMSAIGIESAIIRHTKPERKHYDTIWTLNLGLNLTLGTIIILLSKPFSTFYGDDRLIETLLILGLATALSGLKNVGIADLQRNFNFKADFIYNISSQLIAATVTIILAFVLHSYLALILGLLARSVTQASLSYIASPYRPRLCLQAREEMLSFSIWQSIRSLSVYFFNNGQRLVIGAFYPTGVIGIFSLSTDVSRTMVGEIIAPLSRALLPGLSKIHNEPDWIPRTLPRVLNVTATLSLAFGVGLSAVAEDFVAVVLGGKFLDAIPLVQILALVMAARGFVVPLSTYFIVARMEKKLALITIYEMMTAISLLLYVCSAGMPIIATAYVNAIIGMLLLIRISWLFKKFPNISILDTVISLSRPLLAAIAMYLAVTAISGIVELSPFSRLPLLVMAGGVTYTAALFALWHIMGKPPGIETTFFSKLQPVIRKWHQHDAS